MPNITAATVNKIISNTDAWENSEKYLYLHYDACLLQRLSDRCHSYASKSVYHTAHVKMTAIHAPLDFSLK